LEQKVNLYQVFDTIHNRSQHIILKANHYTWVAKDHFVSFSEVINQYISKNLLEPVFISEPQLKNLIPSGLIDRLQFVVLSFIIFKFSISIVVRLILFKLVLLRRLLLCVCCRRRYSKRSNNTTTSGKTKKKAFQAASQIQQQYGVKQQQKSSPVSTPDKQQQQSINCEGISSQMKKNIENGLKAKGK